MTSPALWRRIVAVVVAGILWGAGCGVALGVVWWRLAPRVPMVIRPEGSSFSQYQPDGFIAADVSFGILALLAGVALTIGLVVMRREHLVSVLGSALLAGIVGSILVGVFATRAINDVNKGQPVGWVDGHPGQVLTQLWGVVVIGLFCAVATWIILKLIDATIGLRVSRDEETEGLDTALHGERVQ